MKPGALQLRLRASRGRVMGQDSWSSGRPAPFFEIEFTLAATAMHRVDAWRMTERCVKGCCNAMPSVSQASLGDETG
jgi:hypothetical protein